jgi:hypothetical protein
MIPATCSIRDFLEAFPLTAFRIASMTGVLSLMTEKPIWRVSELG